MGKEIGTNAIFRMVGVIEEIVGVKLAQEARVEACMVVAKTLDEAGILIRLDPPSPAIEILDQLRRLLPDDCDDPNCLIHRTDPGEVH